VFVLHSSRHAKEGTRLNLLYFVTFPISYCDTLYLRAVCGEILKEKWKELTKKKTHTPNAVEGLVSYCKIRYILKLKSFKFT